MHLTHVPTPLPVAIRYATPLVASRQRAGSGALPHPPKQPEAAGNPVDPEGVSVPGRRTTVRYE